MRQSLIYLIVIVCFQKCISQDTTTIPSTSTISTTTVNPILSLDSKNISWNPHLTEQVIVQCEEGYKIVATIKECSINGTNQEFATISSGRQNETLMFTYDVSNTPSYFFNYNIIYANFTGTNASNLTVVFSRVGESLTTTTTELTSSTIFLPTPSINESYELVVHLTGRDPYEYRNVDKLNSFKYMVSQMAQEYCELANFDLLDNITADNVQIIEIIPCSPQWPKCHPCGEVRFAVPIQTRENPDLISDGYQLNADHLYLMWTRYSEKYLTDGIAVCETQPVDTWVEWQIIVSAACTVVFLGFFLTLRQIVVNYAKKQARKKQAMNDRTPIISEDRRSQVSLMPHYLQEVPSLFENSYSMFNPETGSSNPVFESHGEDIQNNEPVVLEEINIEESGA